MTIQNKTTLKGYFNAGDLPVEAQFADLIDSLSISITVAASNASANSLARADYVCDGTNDEVQIQAAITALPAVGGKVVLSEGLFTIADAGSGFCVQIAKSNVHLVIPAGATVKLRDNEISGVELCNLIRVGNGATAYSNILIDGGGVIDGNTANNTSTGSISLGAAVLITGPNTNITVRGISVINASRDAIHILGASAVNRADGITIDHCIIDNCAEGILWLQANNVVISNCRITNTTEQDGIEPGDDCSYWWITNNYLAGIDDTNVAIDIYSLSPTASCDHGIVTGNVIISNSGAMGGDISVSNGASGPISDILVAGNLIVGGWMMFGQGAAPTATVSRVRVENNIIANSEGYGIWVGIYANGISFVGNTISGCGYSGINVLCDNAEIKNNRIMNCGQDAGAPVGSDVGVKCSGVTGTNIVNNFIYDDQGASNTQYCPINYDTATNVVIINNYFSGHKTSNYPLANASTTPTIKNNIGFITEKGGAAGAVADGGTIAHGMSGTPQIIVLSGSVAGETVSVTGANGTNITVAIKKSDGSAGTAQTIYWRAEMTTFPTF